MVAVAVEPHSAGMGAQRVALVFAGLLEQIVAREYLMLEIFECGVVFLSVTA